MLRHALGLLLALALGLVPARSNAELYRWVDELGVTHYTTDPDEVPREFRSSETVIPTTRPRARSSVPRGPQTQSVPTPEVAPAAPPSASAPATQPEPRPAEPPAPAMAAPPIAEPPPVVAPPAVAPSPATPEAQAVEPPSTPAEATVFPGPPSTGSLPSDDPRATEVAALEAQIATDRESLRQIISSKRWDSSELASDPEIREIAERLPRLQAQLEALRAESVP